VLDVGGDARAWRLSRLRPRHLTLLNVTEQRAEEDWITTMIGDACTGLPPVHADLVFSNSVIEHVGGHWRRQRFAEGIRSAADRYWVQTPYKYFPVEPHFLVPALQHLPRKVQVEIVKRWPVGHFALVTEEETAVRCLMDIELLSRIEFAHYFPDATIVPEKIGPITKSLTAVRA
jgi:hypothetical protein